MRSMPQGDLAIENKRKGTAINKSTICTLTAVFSATTTAVSPALAKRLTQPARLDRHRIKCYLTMPFQT
jgi:hypothetical protein